MAIGQLPKTFDPRKFARQGRQFQGSLALSQFDRLVSSLVDDRGEVQVDLRFSLSENNRVVLEGHVEAELSMICQRCLDVAKLSVRADLHLMGVLTDEQAKALPEDFEPLMYGDEPVELLPILEEELILALPLVAYHPPEDCSAQQYYTTESEEEAQAAAIEADKERRSSNPFSVLAKLKKDTTTQES
ncbi:YceD family protein [Endozoicomonas sp. ALD040]|uniref:YceD family protein n=1 Tax=unclassified Endozoicomonas TaxID=2644528 RepID=UPI003BB181EB